MESFEQNILMNSTLEGIVKRKSIFIHCYYNGCDMALEFLTVIISIG